jgi:hypothetical protein
MIDKEVRLMEYTLQSISNIDRSSSCLPQNIIFTSTSQEAPIFIRITVSKIWSLKDPLIWSIHKPHLGVQRDTSPRPTPLRELLAPAERAIKFDNAGRKAGYLQRVRTDTRSINNKGGYGKKSKKIQHNRRGR